MNIRYRALLTMGGMGLGLGASLSADGGSIPLPVPCTAGAACSVHSPSGISTVSQFVTGGSATQSVNGNTLTVSQASNQAILNWNSFNIGAGGTVVFNQPSSAAIALNKIYQASPSSIFGALKANGQIYLMNANGFVFGQGSTVNVSSLLASSLGLTQGDSELTNGILNSSLSLANLPALQSDGRQYVTDNNGNMVLDTNGNPQPVQIVVQNGAQITAGDSGRVLLAGQSVSNSGTINSPDGQIILAAGQSLYLQAADSTTQPWLRGLVVEVNGDPAQSGSPVESASNLAGGTLSAAHGNVSLVGLAVNQSGRISATTAIASNGSVILQATDSETDSGCSGGASICSTHGDQLVIGSTSVIDLAPDTSDTSTAVAAQNQLQSTIQMSGEQIFMHGGQITAPNGSLSVIAAGNPGAGAVVDGNPAAQIRIDSGTNIDLAGSSANLPMSANLLSIQLFANQLEDDPAQRQGPLHGQTIIVDTRDGRPPIISNPAWQSALSGIQQNILQRTSQGGSASFASEGDIVVNSGADINVSGGQWNYAAGVIQTSQLIGTNHALYSVETANPLLTYTGVLNPSFQQTYSNWGVQVTGSTPGLSQTEAAYSEGLSAGSVSFVGPSLALSGTLQGSAYNGLYQRGVAGIPAESTLQMASGATLAIGAANAAQETVLAVGYVPDFFAPSVTFGATAPTISIADGTPYVSPQVILPTAYLANGFQSTNILSNGTVTVPAGVPLNLNAGGTLNIQAPHIEIGSNITAPGGNITLQAAQTEANLSGVDSRLDVDVADGVTLDVRGQWTNNWQYASSAAGTLPTYQNGGQIDLSLTDPSTGSASAGNLQVGSPFSAGGLLRLGNGVSLEASGGAWLQSNGKLSAGTGGSITLDAGPSGSALQIGSAVALDAFGVDGALGGSLNLRAPQIAIASGAVWAAAQTVDTTNNPAAVLTLGSGLFASDGFSSVSLTATGSTASYATDALTLTTGTTVQASQESWQLQPGFLTNASSSQGVGGFAQPQLVSPYLANPYSMALKVIPDLTDVPDSSLVVTVGQLDLQTASSILAPAGSSKGASINLTGYGTILLNGQIRAPAGTVNVSLADIQQLPLTAGGSSSFSDPGFIPDQRVEIGSGATIDVSGTTVLTPNALGLRLGDVLPGGSVAINAIDGAILADAGSTIDVGGASAVLDRQPVNGFGLYRTQSVGSVGGSLSLSSGEPIWLLGTLEGGAGVDSSGPLAGSSLSVSELLSPIASGSGTQSPLSTISLVANLAGTSPSVTNNNQTMLALGDLAPSGFDALSLQASGSISLGSSIPLALGRTITLDTPNLIVPSGVNAALSAPYLALTNSTGANALSPTGGTGTLTLGANTQNAADNAQQIILSGQVSTEGVDTLSVWSAGDIALQPQLLAAGAAGGSPNGLLQTASALNLSAARLYPATNTVYGFAVPGGNVSITQTSASPGTPMSVNGQLTISATNITSSGSVYAPFGQITLDATNALNLGAGSLTTVSAAGLTLPYGQTELGQLEWIYQGANGAQSVTSVPARLISLSAPQLTLAKGATIDISGGGDLSAFEWVPGTGGSTDALGAASAATAGLYAILPGTVNQYAAYDQQNFLNTGLSGGASVYLSGLAGLPAGVYPLLPARDALLSGAYLVQVEPGYQSQIPGTIGTLTGGTPVVAGYFTFGDTGLRTAGSGFTGFAIYPGSYGQSLATYNLSSASSFFAAQASIAGTAAVGLPADAGTLAINAGTALNAFGSVATAAASTGTAGTIDLSATALTVTNGTAAPSGVSVSASVLDGWNAGNLVLGGQLSADGTTVTVDANSVTVGPGASLVAGQVLAVANNSIDVQGSISSTSGANGKALAAVPSPSSLLLQAAPTATDSAQGAAVLSVSDTSLPVIARSAGATSAGTVLIEGGAQLRTGGALSADAPGGITINGAVSDSGAAVSLASSGIALGGPNGADATTINSGLLAQLQPASSVRLASSGAIDIQSPVTLALSGANSSLTIQGAALNNNQAGVSRFSAATIALQGVGTAPVAPTSGSGTLQFTAHTFDLGPGDLSVNGDAQTSLQLTGAFVGQGSATATMSGNVSIAATELTAVSASNVALAAPGGLLTITQVANADKSSTLSSSLGGGLALSAQQINESGSIIVPGGQIALQATGALNVGSTGDIDAGGITVTAGNQFHTQTQGAAGGTVTLSTAGALTLAPGSAINVAGAGSAPGGALALNGAGAVSLGATLNGAGGSGAQGGSLTVDAGSLTAGEGALAALIGEGINTFTNQIDVHTQSGNLALAAGSAITSDQVVLTSDTGTIEVGGRISNQGIVGNGLDGQIGLYAGSGVTLDSGAALTALGSGNNGRGGQIELATLGGNVTLAQGSQITVGNDSGEGALILRAPATLGSQGAFTGDVNIVNNGASVSGAGQLTVIPVLPTFTATQLGAGADPTQSFAAIETAVSNFNTASNGLIAGRLQGLVPGVAPLVEPGVVVQQSGDLTLSNALDLNAAQSSGALAGPIDLTVQASGNLTVNSTLSDGITASGWTLASAPNSSSLHLIAGAQLNSANPLAVNATASGNLTLESGVLITTGTGNVDLAAAGDIDFSSGSGVFTTGSAGSPTQSQQLGKNLVSVAYLGDGGNVTVTAGGNINAPLLAESPASWQIRQTSGSLAGWGLDLAQYAMSPWSVATLGGGDLRVAAMGTISNLTAATADSLALPAAGGQVAFAGGGLQVAAGGDINSGQYFVADGLGTVSAGRAIVSGTVNGTSTAAVIESQASQVDLWAQTGLTLGAALNPTALIEPLDGLKSPTVYSYSPSASLSLQTSSGDVTLLDGNTNAQFLTGQLGSVAGKTNATQLAAPPSLAAVALTGDVAELQAQNSATDLFPSVTGQIQLFAGHDIVNVSLLMSDAPIATLPTPQNYFVGDSTAGISEPALGAIHQNDPTPISIVAGNDIDTSYLAVPNLATWRPGATSSTWSTMDRMCSRVMSRKLPLLAPSPIR